MKKITRSFYLIFFSLITFAHSYIVTGYYENWSQYRTDTTFGDYKCFPSTLTSYVSDVDIMFYAFAGFNYGFWNGSGDSGAYDTWDDWQIYPLEWNDIKMWNGDNSSLWQEALALKSAGRKIVLSIGGWNWCTEDTGNSYSHITHNFFNQMAADPAKKTPFINSCVAVCTDNAAYLMTGVQSGTFAITFDGIDIDWEYPASTAHSGSAADYQNFYNLIKDLKAALDAEGKILSAAVPAIIPTGTVAGTYNTEDGGPYAVDPSDPITYYEFIARVAKHLTYVNMMAYDYYGAGYAERTADNAPLKSKYGLYSVEQSVNYYVTAFNNVGEDITKIILGIPAYGHTFQGVNFPSQYDASIPFGPGCTYTQADIAGELTKEAGFLSYIEIKNKIVLANGEKKSFFDNYSSLNNSLFAKNYPCLKSQWTDVDQGENINDGYYYGAEYNPETQTWYAYNAKTLKWVSFDAPYPFLNSTTDQSSVVKKCDLIKSQGLGGAMIWAFDDDDFKATDNIKSCVRAQLP